MSYAEGSVRIEAVDTSGHSVNEQRVARANDRSADRSFRFSLRALFLTMSAAALVFWAGAWLYRRAEAVRQQASIENSLKQVRMGISLHADSTGFMPAPVMLSESGKPLTSWRLQILPYLDQRPIDGIISPRRTADRNALIHSRLMSYRASWYCWTGNRNERTTNVFAISGPGTAFDPLQRVRATAIPKSLILAMEIADSKTHWMQPGDYDVAELLACNGRLGECASGILADRIHVLFADGEIMALSPDTPMDAVKPFLTLDGAKTATRDELAPYRVD